MKCTDRTCWKDSEETCKSSLESNCQTCQCGEHLTCHAFLSQIISSPDRREITWHDAETYGDSNWISAEDVCTQIRKAPPEMRTIGYVLWDDEEYIAVCDTVGPEETSSITKIPRRMITGMVHFSVDAIDEVKYS